MRTKRLPGLAVLLSLVCLGGTGEFERAVAQAGELHLKLQLIWGTDGDKPSDPQLRDLAPKLEAKLRRIFKWKNYWEVGAPHAVTIPEQAVRKVAMSDKCELVIKYLGASTIEVKLYGEHKFVRKVRQPIKPGEWSILAGDDKNDTAWFVIMSLKER